MITHSHSHSHAHQQLNAHSQPHSAVSPSTSRKPSPICRNHPPIGSQNSNSAIAANTKYASIPIKIPTALSSHCSESSTSPSYPTANSILFNDNNIDISVTVAPTFSPSNDAYRSAYHNSRAIKNIVSPAESSSSITSLISTSASVSNISSTATQATDPALSSGVRSPSPDVTAYSSSKDSDVTVEGSLIPRKRASVELSDRSSVAENEQNMASVHPVNPTGEVGRSVSATAKAEGALLVRKSQIETAFEDSASSSISDVASLESRSLSPPTHHVVRVRDLSHIRGLVRAELLTGAPAPDAAQIRYDISAMPVEDVIEMVAALLTKITSTNDQHHDPVQTRSVYTSEPANGSISTSVLAFHGKNIPAITILSYLSRVHRYCPTTYEVFLSLLVYFDRMTESVNEVVVKTEGQKHKTQIGKAQTPSISQPQSVDASDVDIDSSDSDSDIVDEESEIVDEEESSSAQTKKRKERSSPSLTTVSTPATYFVVNSYNIHRLIIAGVTCASKFFSDVFYTNSRYAKVGGLPLAELNHLELQFLLLNDFKLFIPAEDLEAYATMLVEFYAREVVSRPGSSSG